MSEVGVWNISSGVPQRLDKTQEPLEKQLEDWIEQDPSLIQSGLNVVGRQVHLKSGILDLLAIDPVGRWAVIEIKRHKVRRQTVAQVVDYAACIADLSSADLKSIVSRYLESQGKSLSKFLKECGLDATIFSDERDILVFAVGTGRDTALESLIKNLSFRGKQISVVNFDVFEIPGGEHLIVRDLTDLDAELPATFDVEETGTVDAEAENTEIQRLFGLADANGVGEAFRTVYAAALECGLYPRTYKWSIMYAPPSNKRRVLICTWVQPKGKLLDIYIGPDAFAEFYGIGFLKLARMGWSGFTGRVRFGPAEAEKFAQFLISLFKKNKKDS